MEQNKFSIQNKRYVLSGATGALGSSISEYLVSNGAKVILLGRSELKLERKAVYLNTLCPGCTKTYVVDLLNEDALRKTKDGIIAEVGAIDGLINLAGGNISGATLTPEQTIFDIHFKDTQSVIDLNLYGTVLPTLVLGEQMAGQGYGSIINISSMAAKRSITRVLGYSMAKAGIEMFTKWMAMELATKYSDKIRVNAIAPGFFIGNQNKKVLINEDGSHTDRSKRILAHTPMNRFGDASELNGMVHYLLSDASSFVTGTIFDVDGGFNSFTGV